MVRQGAGLRHELFILLEENMDEIFAFKRKVIPSLIDIPYVVEDIPAVFAWYPTARKAILWNVNEQPHDFTIKINDRIHSRHTVGALDVTLITGI